MQFSAQEGSVLCRELHNRQFLDVAVDLDFGNLAGKPFVDEVIELVLEEAEFARSSAG